MKVVFGLFAVLAVLGFLLYQFGGLAGYDPAEQADEFLAAVKPGDAYTKVLDQRVPKTWAVLDYTNQYDLDGRGASRDFDEPAFRDAMTKGTGPADGFVFEYIFDAEHAYDLYFNGTGTLESIQDAFTANDLLNGGMGD